MSAVDPVGLGAGAGAAGCGAGAGGAGCEAWWRRLRFFFFFLGVFGFTGALGGRTVLAEVPPVAWRVPLEVLGPGATPPDVEELVEPPEGALVPPVAAEAVLVPHARARTRTAMASIERMRLHPCMGLCFERASMLLA